MSVSKGYRVVICGGGLAGLTLSLQLKKELPEAAITVIEKIYRPLPEAAHKVGESTVEIGAHYFSSVVGLKLYLEHEHYPKLGLRYFYENDAQHFEERPELGPSMFSPVPTYQIDRGRMENDMREMALNAGVDLIEGASIKDISIQNPEKLNQVSYELNGEELTIEANWVVDAMGRRRFLQSKLGLRKESPHKASSVWFRMEGKISVDDLTSEKNATWQARNLEDRFYSTNHLMGHGYWVWLIPLSSGNTSIGIVTQNDIHDFAAYSRSYETSLDWLKNHEPHLAQHLLEKHPLDFRKIKNYSYGSEQLFSENGWSCVGEAGIFSDPFYSPGSDMIAITNTLTYNLIKEDIQGNSITDKVAQLNQFVLQRMFPDQLSYYTDGYHTFGNTRIAASKFLWDTLYYWRVYAHAYMTGVFHDLKKLETFEKYVQQFSKMNMELQIEFRKLAESNPNSTTFTHIDLARKKTFIESAISLLTNPSDTAFEQHLEHQLEYLKNLKEALLTEVSSTQVSSTSSFADFFDRLTTFAKLQNKYNRSISKIGNGAFILHVRDAYINLAVRGKRKVYLSSLLRVLYPN